MKSTPAKRGERLGTRLILLPYLLESRRWSQKELMEYFQVDRKTIVSTIDTLSLPGQPNLIVEERAGRHVYYRLSEAYIAPSLTLAESAALLLAQEAIGATEWSPFARHARSLLKKVRKVLPPALHKRLDAMAKVYGAAITPAKDFARHDQTINELVTAAIEQQTVRMHYQSFGASEPRARDFDPYAVYFDPDGATLKVIGWDYNRQDFIPFSIDHIHAVQSTQRHFTRRPFNLRDHLETYCFNGIHGDPMTVRLRAYGVTASVFAERKFHRSQRTLARSATTTTTPETITIEMRVARGRGLERFILSWLPDIEVIAPTELRQQITEILQRGGERNASG
ncbi:MAG TPA: WYL domain-containing transcriptional regulator [Blastocatellia bacterium]|nr:WYL domain-containing transcriptional regulator [Blastocatellia bacterium]